MMSFIVIIWLIFNWLNKDIESVLQGKFINDEDY